MLFLLRRLKHNEFMSEQFRKYLGYAIGELLLVVIGILIALQIDNWNDDRKERNTLQSYLESIARNMREDLAELEPLRALGVERLYLISRFDTIRNKERFEVDEIFYYSRICSLADPQTFFSANTSGFEALKSSGVLNRLQGSGLERLLSRYYDIVNQINRLESAMADKASPLLSELRQTQPAELESWAILNPSSLLPERFQEAQPLFARVVNSPTTAALVDSQFKSHSLVLHYDSLASVGNTFIRAVESGRLDTPEAALRTAVDDFRDGLGPALILVDGYPASQSYWTTTTSGPGNDVFRLNSVRLDHGVMHVDYPGGEDWAVVYWGTLAPNPPSGLPHQDYSRFDRLHLEMKGEQGGEVIKVHVKDADYPNDIAPISVDLVLTDGWQTFEIDLAEFAPNDLSRLTVPLGLLIDPAQEPLSYSIRNARYE